MATSYQIASFQRHLRRSATEAHEDPFIGSTAGRMCDVEDAIREGDADALRGMRLLVVSEIPTYIVREFAPYGALQRACEAGDLGAAAAALREVRQLAPISEDDAGGTVYTAPTTWGKVIDRYRAWRPGEATA